MNMILEVMYRLLYDDSFKEYMNSHFSFIQNKVYIRLIQTKMKFDPNLLPQSHKENIVNIFLVESTFREKCVQIDRHIPHFIHTVQRLPIELACNS